MAIAGLYECFNHWHQSGTLFIYSDPHFGDKELAACQPNRPSDEEQVKIINSKVGKKDTIIFLGDIGDTEWIKKIRGYKVLVMGNHDTGRTKYERIQKNLKFDKEVYSLEEIKKILKIKYFGYNFTIGEGYDFHKPFTFWNVVVDNKLFDEVYEGPLMISEKLILSHEPVNVPWAFNIHGHMHESKHNDKMHFNVCSDVIGFTPINFNQWIKRGYLSDVETIHRNCIRKANIRAKNKK